MPNELASVLLWHRARSAWAEPGDFVFCNERGKPSDPDNLRHRVLYPAMQRAGIERGERTHGFHIFRHSGASIVHAEKKTLGPGQELLRHTSPVTTQGYTHVERVGEEASEILAREFLTNCGLSVAESWVKPN
jgi:site-specific recombinase XerD